MGLGLDVRLSRLFSHTSGNLFGIAVDHFVGYGNVREGGLSNLPEAVARCVSAGPDTMTMTPGTAKSCWPAQVGKASLIVQASLDTRRPHPGSARHPRRRRPPRSRRSPSLSGFGKYRG